MNTAGDKMVCCLLYQTVIQTFGLIPCSALPFCAQLNKAAEPVAHFCIRDTGTGLPPSTRGPSSLKIRDHSDEILLRGRVVLIHLEESPGFHLGCF